MATGKNSSGHSVTSNKISVTKCLEALAHMQEQMRVILPYLPEHLTSKITLPDLALKTSVSGGHRRKKHDHGGITEMFSIKKDMKSTESDDENTDFENDPILVNSKLFLENFKSGAIKRELKKSKNIHKVLPPCKPIRFHPPITRPSFKIPLLQPIEEPNILKEQHPKINLKPKNLFTTKEEAERFMMCSINEIIQLFSQIANAFKSDAVKRMNQPPTAISQKAYVVECCMQTMMELQVLVNGPVKKLRNELTENFIAVLPEFKSWEDSNYTTSCSYWQKDSGHQRERATGDGC